MRLPPQHAYLNQETSFLAHSGRSGSIGPAIFHVAVPPGAAELERDKKIKENDDDLTSEISEKGFSNYQQDTQPQPNAIAVDAVLAAPEGSRWSKYYCVFLVLAICVILALVIVLAISNSNNGSSQNGPKDEALPIRNNETKTLSSLDQILMKGYISCGVADQMGYSARNASNNKVEGFEVDLVRDHLIVLVSSSQALTSCFDSAVRLLRQSSEKHDSGKMSLLSTFFYKQKNGFQL
jgi:hypothetical protein